MNDRSRRANADELFRSTGAPVSDCRRGFALANRTGFDIVEFDHLGRYPIYFMFDGSLFMIATAYEKTISCIDVLRFLRGSMFVVLHKRALSGAAP